MLSKRIIPTLIMKNEELIHRSNFDLSTDRYVGDPLNTINVFNKFNVDEIIIVDIENTIKKKKINFGLLKEIASEAFFPLCYGGGINNIKDAEKIISIGFEKIAINNHFFLDKDFIIELAKTVGAQSIVVSLDVIVKNNSYQIYNYTNKTLREHGLINYLNLINVLEIGELLITNVDLDGTMKGCDLNLLNQCINQIKIPVIYKGGMSSFKDIENVFKSGASAITSSTFFIMKKPDGGIVLNYPNVDVKESYENL